MTDLQKIEAALDALLNGHRNYPFDYPAQVADRAAVLAIHQNMVEQIRAMARIGINQEGEISDLRARAEAAEKRAARFETSVHTCHDQCDRYLCVMRRERDAVLAELARVREAHARAWRTFPRLRLPLPV